MKSIVMLLLLIFPAVASSLENEGSSEPDEPGDEPEPAEEPEPTHEAEDEIEIDTEEDAGPLVLPPPQNIGGLAILPLDAETDVPDLIRHLYVDDDEAILLVTGAQSDRFSVNGIRLQLPPPFLVFQLDTGVAVVAVVRGTEVHEERVPTAEGELAHFDTNRSLSSRKTDDEIGLERQRELLASLYASLDETDEVVEKIRICIRFVEIYPEGEATEKARAILADLRRKIEDEDESSLDLSEDAQVERDRFRRLEAFAMAPRPPGTAGRKIGGLSLLGGAVALGIGAGAFDRTAIDAAAQYHQLTLQSTEAAAAPYLDQARRNDRAFQASLVGAISCGTLAAALLVADALVERRWHRAREALEIEEDEPSHEPEAALVPAPLDGGFGVALGGVF